MESSEFCCTLGLEVIEWTPAPAHRAIANQHGCAVGDGPVQPRVWQQASGRLDHCDDSCWSSAALGSRPR